MSSLRRIFFVQGLCIAWLGLGVWVLVGHTQALSCWAGCAASLIPTWMCGGLMLWGKRGADIVRLMYVGELMKWCGTALLFLILIFIIHPIWWVCLLGFVCTQVSLYIAALCCATHQEV